MAFELTVQNHCHSMLQQVRLFTSRPHQNVPIIIYLRQTRGNKRYYSNFQAKIDFCSNSDA